MRLGCTRGNSDVSVSSDIHMSVRNKRRCSIRFFFLEGFVVALGSNKNIKKAPESFFKKGFIEICL